jgi:predicted DNA-binding ribbon-helix-helix protein
MPGITSLTCQVSWCGRAAHRIKRSIGFAGRHTSVSLEDEFWNALKEIAGGRPMKLPDLVGAIDAQRQKANLSSALRLFVLEYYQSKSAEKLGDEMLGERSVPPRP